MMMWKSWLGDDAWRIMFADDLDATGKISDDHLLTGDHYL